VGWTLDDDRVAVGFARDANTAVGITFDLGSGTMERPFSRQTRNAILGTIPGTAAGKLVYWVDVVGSPLVGLRTVAADPAFAVGASGDSLVRRDAKGVHPLWSGIEAGQDVADVATPRVATAKDGHVMVTRVGGKSGRIVAGWLTPAGEPRGPLQVIESPDPEVGTPGVSLSDGVALVSFSARPSPDAPWRIRMAALRPDAKRATTSLFEVPSGGPGEPAISPATDALPDGRFLMVWTEGASGSRDVRAEVLDANLVAASSPVTLSPEGSNAGKGVPFTDGSRALVVFYVKNDSSQQLWGATLKCQ
jgi:hypothetical protein